MGQNRPISDRLSRLFRIHLLHQINFISEARLKIEINDKQGPKDIPLEYWASEKCGELHRIRIKSCIYTDCPDYKKTQVELTFQLS